MHIPSRLKNVSMEEIPNITSDIIKKLKKLKIDSVYQLAVQSPFEIASEYEDTSLNVESASALIANARKILTEHKVLADEFSTADEVSVRYTDRTNSETLLMLNLMSATRLFEQEYDK
jgi:RecG-like helicase